MSECYRVQLTYADGAPGSDAPERLAAYRAARNRFIEIGRDVVPTRDVRRMLAQVGEPLLGVLRTSPDFRPAYDPLQRMATALARSDPGAARTWFDALARLRPVRGDAEDTAVAVPR